MTLPGRAVSRCILPILCLHVGCFSSTDDSANPGAGGSTTQDGAPASPAAQELIDDMEDMDGSILAKAGRIGAWYTYNDATATGMQKPTVMTPFTMTAGGRDGAGYAANTVGGGFTVWGAGTGFNLHDPGDGNNGSAKTPYDASAYTGIVFWAKAGASSTTSLRVNVSDKNTDPAGGICAPADKCNDHFGKDINLTANWAMYTMKFDDLLQLGWGQSFAALDVAHLYAVQFQVGKATTFDVWLDDVAFLTK